MSNSFESFLQQHDDTDWLQVLFKLEPNIHPVDQRATRIWFAFFPLKLKRSQNKRTTSVGCIRSEAATQFG